MSICNICERVFNQTQGRNRKRCDGCSTKVRRHVNLVALVKMLGGKCVECGYNDNPIALQFHHKDPETKKFGISQSVGKSWKSVKNEALKCELLCSNCHTILHSNRQQPPFLEAVKNFKGRSRL